MTTPIDLGDGRTVHRHNLPKDLVSSFDSASDQLNTVRAKIRERLRSMIAMQAPADFSGDVVCNVAPQSGRTYSLSEVGGAILVDGRDATTFLKLGFTNVTLVQPTSGLRAGLVFFDAVANSYCRYDGTAWAAVALV